LTAPRAARYDQHSDACTSPQGAFQLIVDVQIHLWNAGNPTSLWHRLYNAFGPTRFFWGRTSRMTCPWRQCVTLFTEELPWLKGRDLELVMGRAVCHWLGWKR
jgi:hypothetical protein